MNYFFTLGESSKSFTGAVTPESVRPYPRPCIERKKKENKKSRKGKSRIYTDTPEKNRLEEIEQERENRRKKKEDIKKRRVMRQVFSEQNKKDKTASKNNRRPSTTSTETDQSLVLESDDLSDQFSEDIAMDLLKDDDVINKNDFLLIKFPSKTNVVHYVGMVTEIINPNEYMVRFLRRKVPSDKFYYPAVEDTSIVDRCDIVLKLTAPEAAKTARTSSLFSFKIDFSTYHVN